MNISLDDLLKGKATKIKNKEYAETEAYVTPFLERLQSITNNFQVKVELPNQMTILSSILIRLSTLNGASSGYLIWSTITPIIALIISSSSSDNVIIVLSITSYQSIFWSTFLKIINKIYYFLKIMWIKIF